MMGKKNKRLYDRMQYGIQEKQKQNDLLMKKRKSIEEAQGGVGEGDDKSKAKGVEKGNKKQKKSK
ncbi:hypothetical protein EON65_58345 [archaeon]|nr:MAG: hypothetical protein EON65_58345 [archaeon]